VTVVVPVVTLVRTSSHCTSGRCAGIVAAAVQAGADGPRSWGFAAGGRGVVGIERHTVLVLPGHAKEAGTDSYDGVLAGIVAAVVVKGRHCQTPGREDDGARELLEVLFWC